MVEARLAAARAEQTAQFNQAVSQCPTSAPPWLWSGNRMVSEQENGEQLE